MQVIETPVSPVRSLQEEASETPGWNHLGSASSRGEGCVRRSSFLRGSGDSSPGIAWTGSAPNSSSLAQLECWLRSV